MRVNSTLRLRCISLLVTACACGSSESPTADAPDASNATGGGGGMGGVELDASSGAGGDDRDRSPGESGGGDTGARESGSDDAMGQDARIDLGTGEAADTGTASYYGCTYIGALDRIVISKSDPARDLCFALVLVSPANGPPTSGLTLPSRYGLESAEAGRGSTCRSRIFSPIARTTQVQGVVDAPDAGVTQLEQVNVDVVLAFSANDAGVPASEHMLTEGLDVRPICP